MVDRHAISHDLDTADFQEAAWWTLIGSLQWPDIAMGHAHDEAIECSRFTYDD